MRFAVNYSQAAADLFREGLIQLDLFKCPFWPHLIEEAQSLNSVYVHFPFKVGRGSGEAWDVETERPVQWELVERIMARTDTPLINLHLTPTPEDIPDLPPNSLEPAHVEEVTERLLRDVRAVVAEIGAEHVIVESDYGLSDVLRPAFLPEVIRRVVEETGCGFLLDLSHVRLAARQLGMEPTAYLQGLPLTHTRELHITGIQTFDESWVARLREAEVEPATIARFAGRQLDHLPLTEEDWNFVTRALTEVHSGKWGNPWVATLEYGGVGRVWEALTEEEVLADQAPRLYDLVKE